MTSEDNKSETCADCGHEKGIHGVYTVTEGCQSYGCKCAKFKPQNHSSASPRANGVSPNREDTEPEETGAYALSSRDKPMQKSKTSGSDNQNHIPQTPLYGGDAGGAKHSEDTEPEESLLSNRPSSGSDDAILNKNGSLSGKIHRKYYHSSTNVPTYIMVKDVKESVQKLMEEIKWLEDEWEISEENYECYDDWVEFKKKIDKIFGSALI